MDIEAVDLSFAYGERKIIRECSFKLENGKIYCILGRNGSGKTTLLKILNGNLKPSAGRVLLEGKDIKNRSRKEIARILGFVPQEHSGVFTYTVLDMAVMGRNPYIGMFSRPTALDYQIAQEALDMVGLLSLKDRCYMKISGGERQLVFLARAIAQEANFLILDEPTSHLDFSNQHAIMKIIRRIVENCGTGAIIAMHDPNLTMAFADEVLILKDGRLQAQGSVDQVMTSEKLRYLYDIDIRIACLEDGQKVVIS